jgi:hypothetical protein
LSATTSLEEQTHLSIFIGIDAHDILYDNVDAKERIKAEVCKVMPTVSVHFSVLKSRFRGKLCFIWNELAKQACREGCDFFVLVGDDILFETKGWKTEIEGHFELISRENQLPYGFGCVSFRDNAFRVFPTFPVMHRLHMEIFQDELFPQNLLISTAILIYSNYIADGERVLSLPLPRLRIRLEERAQRATRKKVFVGVNKLSVNQSKG